MTAGEIVLACAVVVTWGALVFALDLGIAAWRDRRARRDKR